MSFHSAIFSASDSILPHPDVAALRDRRGESGYRHVYRVHATISRYAAKVRVNGRLHRLKGSASSLPHQAALHAVRWYQERYGANWKEVVGLRMARRNPWKVWYSQARGGFLARVWELGKPVEVTGRRRPGAGHLRTGTSVQFDADGKPVPGSWPSYDTASRCTCTRPTWKRPGRLLVFASAAEAELAIRGWIAARWGEGERVKESVWRI